MKLSQRGQGEVHLKVNVTLSFMSNFYLKVKCSQRATPFEVKVTVHSPRATKTTPSQGHLLVVSKHRLCIMSLNCPESV